MGIIKPENRCNGLTVQRLTPLKNKAFTPAKRRMKAFSESHFAHTKWVWPHPSLDGEVVIETTVADRRYNNQTSTIKPVS
jgi:hypothetical protein